MSYLIKKGDRRPTLSGQLLQNGAAIDLTTASGVTFRMRKPGGTVISAAASVDDAATGMVSYAWQSGDLDEVGTYTLEWIIDWGGGSLQTLPSSGTTRITVDDIIS